MSSINWESVSLLMMTGAVWGISTPLLKKYSKGIEDVKHCNPVYEFVLQLKFMFTNWKYLLPFMVNQSGSLLYTICLAYNPITISVPVTNALNFVFVLITGKMLGESTLDSKSLLGSFFVVFGIILCLLNDHF